MPLINLHSLQHQKPSEVGQASVTKSNLQVQEDPAVRGMHQELLKQLAPNHHALVITNLNEKTKNGHHYCLKIDATKMTLTEHKTSKKKILQFDFSSKTLSLDKVKVGPEFFPDFRARILAISKDLMEKKATCYQQEA